MTEKSPNTSFRPYFDSSIFELEAFARQTGDPKELRKISDELTHRSTVRSQALREEVDKKIATLAARPELQPMTPAEAVAELKAIAAARVCEVCGKTPAVENTVYVALAPYFPREKHTGTWCTGCAQRMHDWAVAKNRQSDNTMAADRELARREKEAEAAKAKEEAIWTGFNEARVDPIEEPGNFIVGLTDELPDVQAEDNESAAYYEYGAIIRYDRDGDVLEERSNREEKHELEEEERRFRIIERWRKRKRARQRKQRRQR